MPFDGTPYESRVISARKLDQVIDLLSDRDRWCKGALFLAGKRRCIVGAMQAVDGVADLRGPVLQAIGEVTGKRYLGIEAFNDARATTHALVMQVLIQARSDISGNAACAPRVATVPLGLLDRLKLLFA